jgi:uncharacterized protein
MVLRAGSRVGPVIQMELMGIRLEQPANQPLLLLRETGGQGRILPIYIGGPEAAAIAYALEGVPTPRPLTHDLLKDTLEELGATLDRIVVTELREHTFYAELQLMRGEERHAVSSRPSDAVALAVRTQSPIFASELVLEQAGQVPGEGESAADDEPESEQLVDEFRAFLDEIDPDDFKG